MKGKIVRKAKRDKAFIGAAIGAVTSIAGSLISGNKQKKAAEAAFQQEQAAQTEAEGFQEAAALSSTYGNQDYVTDYQKKIALKNGGKVSTKGDKFGDRISRAKKFKHGGRAKANIGTFLRNSGKDLITDVRENPSDAITSVGNAVSTSLTNQEASPLLNQGTITAASNTIANRQIAAEANAKRYQNKNGGKTSLKGSRKKAMFGDAAGGIGGLVSSLINKPEAPKQVKVADGGFSFDAPKTGLAQSSYATTPVGAPATAINTTATPINPANEVNPEYRDRLAQARLGKRVKRK